MAYPKTNLTWFHTKVENLQTLAAIATSEERKRIEISLESAEGYENTAIVTQKGKFNLYDLHIRLCRELERVHTARQKMTA